MILYFAGCIATYRLKSIAQSTVKLLKKANVEFDYLGDNEWCCGSVLFRIGFVNDAEKMMAHNKQFIERYDTVVTSCAGCYHTLTWNYRYEKKRIYHINQYINDLVIGGKLKFSKSAIRVTYHDPCHIGRTAGIYEEPRSILRSIEGLELVEMVKNRENARCCGGGGGVKAGYKELAEQLAVRRVKDAENTNAILMLTGCPFCVLNLRDAATKMGSNIRIQDITEFLVDIVS